MSSLVLNKKEKAKGFPEKPRILSCSCNHPFQDERFGKGKRYHNPTRKDPPPIYRCTVCSNEKAK